MSRCSECEHLDSYSMKTNGACWCSKNDEWVFPSDYSCCNFNNGRSWRNAEILEDEEKNTSLGCYLTTMLCNILKMEDNNKYLETMRAFRNDVLQKNENYKSLLVEYDIVGPKIATALNNDRLKEKIAKLYFNKYIINITELITKKEIDSAVNLYKQMTNSLKSFYNITNYEITDKIIKDADALKSGHGKYIQKKKILY